jgi:hypothetical protein
MPAGMSAPIGIGHNGGPPLEDEHVPEWGHGGAYPYFRWKAAHRAAWKSVSRDVALSRLARAERVGLSYEEYTLELLERGLHLQPEDADRVAGIKARRDRKRLGAG